MAKTRPPYPPEFRRQMVELVRAGRSPEELAQEFEPTAQSIRNWVGRAECDAGRRSDGLTTAEREELNQLRRENHPSGGPEVGPSLTAAARDGRILVRAGMEEWLRRGPNKRSYGTTDGRTWA